MTSQNNLNAFRSETSRIWLRRFSKFVCFATLCLIFVGGLVKSTESGLAVPDWPLSYGMWMPPMVGGVFYEHGHRMVAAFVGAMTVIMALWMTVAKARKWIVFLSWISVGTVIVQGILGGITVLMYLPAPVSVAHGTLAQIFFLITIVLAYSLSLERQGRFTNEGKYSDPKMIRFALILLGMIFVQLVLGATMRHLEAGLAIYDFPQMGGQWIPLFNKTMLSNINDWRFEHNFEFVSKGQVIIHFVHRFWAILIAIKMIFVVMYVTQQKTDVRVAKTTHVLAGIIVFQIILGIATIMSVKEVYITTAHVATGALALGFAMLLVLRTSPLSWNQFLTFLKK